MTERITKLKSVTLDWLAFTSVAEDILEKQFRLIYANNHPVVPIAARNGYRDAERDNTGVVRMWNVDRPEMGTHYIIPGSALRQIFDDWHFLPQTVLKDVLHFKMRITRLDLACDAQDVELDYERLFDKLKSEGRKGTARAVARIQGDDGGNTIYVGSRQSERFLRIYDKAKESKLEDRSMHRMEFELKGQAARAVAHALNQGASWAQVFNALAVAMVDAENIPELGIFWLDDADPIGLPKIERHSDTEAWIVTQVTPAVVKWFAEHPDSKAVIYLMEALKFMRGMGQ